MDYVFDNIVYLEDLEDVLKSLYSDAYNKGYENALKSRIEEDKKVLEFIKSK
jgi:hypothetical protein